LLVLRLIDSRTCAVSKINALLISPILYLYFIDYFSDKYYSKYAKLGQIGAVANSQKPASLTPPSGLDIDDSSQQQQRDNEVSEYYEMPPPQKEKEAWKYVPKTEIGKDVAPKREQFVDFEGFRFPVRLDNPWAVGKILNQSKGKVSMKELKSNKKSTLKLTAQAKVC
jgi:hypothetical protein